MRTYRAVFCLLMFVDCRRGIVAGVVSQHVAAHRHAAQANGSLFRVAAASCSPRRQRRFDARAALPSADEHDAIPPTAASRARHNTSTVFIQRRPMPLPPGVHFDRVRLISGDTSRHSSKRAMQQLFIGGRQRRPDTVNRLRPISPPAISPRFPIDDSCRRHRRQLFHASSRLQAMPLTEAASVIGQLVRRHK